MEVHDLPTPALIIDVDALDANLTAMATAHPGRRLRPHVKAHKCTSLAARQQEHGHDTFTCATPREAVGMAEAGLGTDLLVANEVLDPRRLEALAALGDDVRVTMAVDSEETIAAAAVAGIRHCLIDVDVGLPRCGCDPADAGRLADLARTKGIDVRGVMGYEGHLMVVTDRQRQRHDVEAAMERVRAAHADVGGEVVSAGGTGTYDLHEATGVTEVQAGSYTLMDTYYATLGLPFEQAVFVVGTVISVRPTHAVGDVGLKALGMDHGNPAIAGAAVWFCSDEHVTFSTESPPHVGDRIRVVPAHVDPTVAMHEVAWLVREDDVVDRWPIDLPRLGMKRLSWLGAGALAGIAASPWLTMANGRLVTVTRSLMPWAGLTGAPMALLAWRHGHRRAALVHAVVATTTAAICRPLVRRPTARLLTNGPDQPLSVLHANLLYINRDMAGVARELRPLDADVVTFSEYTPHHAAELRASWLEPEYAFRVERSARGASGTALWSRHPITERSTARTKHHTVVADVHAPGGMVRVIVIHTQSPIVHHGEWLTDLGRLGAMPIDGPAVMTGDFNAGWWHPEFRALFRSGWRDAHVAVGRGLSCSWPTERWHALFNWHPPFVRLDHALISGQLTLLDVVDVDVPGSDHRGLVVTVAPTPPAAP